MKNLTVSEKQKFRAQAHKLKPIVMISEKGLVESVIKEIDRSLKAHELLKIRIFTENREEREKISEEICAQTNSIHIQLIGKILIIYRQNDAVPEKLPKAEPPRSNKKQPRRS